MKVNVLIKANEEPNRRDPLAALGPLLERSALPIIDWCENYVA